MASPTAQNTKPELPSSTPRGPDRPGVPLRGTSQNYINARAQADSKSTPTSPSVHIPDGRKTHTGEAVVSPTEAWKPDFRRKQSWNQEDLKREIMMTGIKPQENEGQKRKMSIIDTGLGRKEDMGFTELTSPVERKGEEEK